MIEAIPIIDSNGEQTGTISVGEHGEAIITGKIRLPWGADPEEVAGTKLGWVIPPALDREPPDPELVARVSEAFPSTYERLVADPRHAAAAARGLAVHEQALKLCEEQAIPYEEAIVHVLQGREK